MARRPVLAVTTGDPAGIGPEICLKACAMPVVQRAAKLVLVGTESILERTARELKLPQVWKAARDEPAVGLVDVGGTDEGIRWGEVSPAAGRLSAAYLDRALDLALEGRVDGIVTAPISKDAWHRAGVKYPGHTEVVAERLGAYEYGMMLVQDRWRVLHLSTHCSLRDAVALVKKERIVRMLRLFDRTLRDFEIASPSIAVAGLNPHAGEGGLFGEEEISQIAPAVEEARCAGLRVTGPISPDVVFARARTGEFDGVLAMYHDQGHIAVKTVMFEPGPGGRWSSIHGVNVTVGLPTVRTSVDHGVAFDIAGQGIARPDSLVDAILLAAQMVRSRARAGGGRA